MSNEPKPGRSLAELFTYARLMETEAAKRYAQLADMMSAHNNVELAAFFRRMSEIEWLHVYRVGELRREAGVEESEQARQKPGGALEAPEVPDPMDVHYLHRPYHALQLARQYEERAFRFYADLARVAETEEVREQARRFAAEEENHIREVEKWLSRQPVPEQGWDEDPDPPNEAE